MLVLHAECGVPGRDDVPRQIDDPLEHGFHTNLRGDRECRLIGGDQRQALEWSLGLLVPSIRTGWRALVHTRLTMLARGACIRSMSIEYGKFAPKGIQTTSPLGLLSWHGGLSAARPARRCGRAARRAPRSRPAAGP